MCTALDQQANFAGNLNGFSTRIGFSLFNILLNSSNSMNLSGMCVCGINDG